MNDREELLVFAHEAIMSMLSYKVDNREAYLYLTNKLDLMDGSYELQCCIFEEDPLTYIRECERLEKMKKDKKRKIKPKTYTEERCHTQNTQIP